MVDHTCNDDVHWHSDRIEPNDSGRVVFASVAESLVHFILCRSGQYAGFTYGLRISHITVMKAWLPAYAKATFKTDSNC